jgi:CRISPR-associated protein Cas2
MKKKKKELSFFERIMKIRRAGLKDDSDLTFVKKNYEILPLKERLPLVDKILNNMKTKTADMMYAFILYDIENNKIRTQIAKYLIKNNCHRVQKSVFLAELKRKKYHEIHQTLKEINAMYDNHDSIFFIPIGEDILNKMKIVGLNIDFELITKPGNTMFI